MPPLIAKRPRDERGFPILFTTYIREDGTPDFRANERDNVEICFHERRCSICGEVIQGWMVFLAGPEGVANRCFGDPPAHPPCIEYARRVCPYLALGRDRKLQWGDTLDGFRVSESAAILSKSDYYGLYFADTYIGLRPKEGGFVFVAGMPSRILWYHQPTGQRKTPPKLRPLQQDWPEADEWVLPHWNVPMRAEHRRRMRRMEERMIEQLADRMQRRRS